MNHVESLHQRAYFDWASLHPRARHAFAIPNGGRRNAREAARMKGEGVRAGVPDVMLPIACGGAHGLWLEFKAPGNKPSGDQAQRIADLVGEGYAVAVVYTVDHARAATLAYLRGDFGPSMMILGYTPRVRMPRRATA